MMVCYFVWSIVYWDGLLSLRLSLNLHHVTLLSPWRVSVIGRFSHLSDKSPSLFSSSLIRKTNHTLWPNKLLRPCVMWNRSRKWKLRHWWERPHIYCFGHEKLLNSGLPLESKFSDICIFKIDERVHIQMNSDRPMMLKGVFNLYGIKWRNCKVRWFSNFMNYTYIFRYINVYPLIHRCWRVFVSMYYRTS